ncbi:MAG: hypothetical protein ABSC62_03930 [Terracidiphilus sp.]|jgi:hypothetical protein
MRRAEGVVLIAILLVISAAMLVLVAVETVNCVKRFQSSVLIQKDVEEILHPRSGSEKPSLPDASQRYLADLAAIQKDSQDSGTASFLYTLTMFAVVLVSGFLYKDAVAKLNAAQGLIDEHRRSVSQTQAAALSLAVAEGLAVQIGKQGTVALTSVAPVMRDCIKDIDNSLQNLRRNRGAISPVLYDGLRNGVGRVRTCLSNIPRDGGAAEVKDILDKVKDLCDLLNSREFSKACRRDFGRHDEG